MVSVIFGILKITGMILLGILCLAFLLVLAVLLIPVRFDVRCSLQDKKPEGRAVVSWLLHILSACVAYNGRPEVVFRVFGFRVRARKTGQSREPGEKRKPKKKQRQQKPAEKNTGQEPCVPAEVQNGQPAGGDTVDEGTVNENTAGGSGADARKTESAGISPLFLLRRIYEKVEAGIRRIRERLQALWQKVLKLREKKEKLQAFWANEENRATIKLAKRQLVKLVKHFFPRRLRGRLKFGFDDPCTTGQVLACISPFYGLYAGRLELIPVFEEAVLEGNLQVKGRVRIGTVLVIAVRMLLDKNFRRLLKKLWKV